MPLPREESVLDKGFVRLVDHMGSDLTVVNAARVSFNKISELEAVDPDPDCPDCGGDGLIPEEDRCWYQCSCHLKLSDKDAKLIRYLARHEHWTPFGHPQITLHMKVPIFVARQWMRSNVGIVYNEVSRRYVDDEPEFYEPATFRLRPEGGIKQGSGESVMLDYGFQAHADALCDYHKLLEANVAPEMARMVLPVSLYTEYWMTASLAACARMFRLRVDSHAQWEIQRYAQSMGNLIEPRFPVSWEALTSDIQGTTETQ